MEFKLISSGALRHCPSVADTIDAETKLFIIGCYQLIEKDDPTVDQESLDGKNERLGSLILIKDINIVYQLNCQDGGVFDLTVVKPIDGENGLKRVFAAHSNGNIASYNVINNQDNQVIQLFQRIETESSMLCSIATLDPLIGLIVAGDATSRLVVVDGLSLIVNFKMNEQSDDPIWCIKTMKHDENHFLIMTGSEDSQLRFFILRDATFSKCISTVKDFEAGVTSIALIKNPEQSDDNYSDGRDYVLYTGSYDEKIRIYRLKVSLVDGCDCSIELNLMKEVHLNGSGIWKLITIKSDHGDWPYILIAAMYAGAYVMEKFSILSSIKIDGEVQLDQINDENGSEKRDHLVYGVAATPNVNQIIVTSFYGKRFFCFMKNS